MTEVTIKKGMQFKVKEMKNPLINTKVGHIIEIVSVGKSIVEFRDLTTFDYGLVKKEDINKCMAQIE